MFEFVEMRLISLPRLPRLRILVCPLEWGGEAFVVVYDLDRVVIPH